MKSILFFLISSVPLLPYCVFGQMKPKWQFRDELIAHLNSPKDTVYIQNRHHLEKCTGLKSTTTSAQLAYTTRAGATLTVFIQTGKFDAKKHAIRISDTMYNATGTKSTINYSSSTYRIDGKKIYGRDGGLPKNELKELSVIWNGKRVAVPLDSVSNCYEIHPKSMEVYCTPRFLYVYLSGSDGAGSYSVKFIFNQKKYLTRIISRNECTDGYDFIDALPDECE